MSGRLQLSEGLTDPVLGSLCSRCTRVGRGLSVDMEAWPLRGIALSGMENSARKCMEEREAPGTPEVSGRLPPGVELTSYCGLRAWSRYLAALGTYVAHAVHV